MDTPSLFVGTSVENDDFEQCHTECGSSWADACEFEFRVTQRYAGDNYRVYFYQRGSEGILKSALVTAWKRAYVENDAMCRIGGMLYADPDSMPDADIGDNTVKIAKEKVGETWERRDAALDSHLNQVIHIFDSVNTFEGSHDIAYICDPIADNPEDPYIEVSLGTEPGDNCLDNPYQLQYRYNGIVPTPGLLKWDFAHPDPPPLPAHQGKGGGVCVNGTDPDEDFFRADPSQLNRRDLTGPYDDAFISFSVPKDGARVVPFLPHEWFDRDIHPHADWCRMSQLWFDNKKPYSGDPLFDDPHNYFHLIGASASLAPSILAGGTAASCNLSLIFIGTVKYGCSVTSYPAPDEDTCVANYTVHDTDHELAHQFNINEDTTNGCSGGHDPGAGDPVPTSNDAWCSGSPGCIEPGLPNARCLMSGDTNGNSGLEAPQRRDQVNRLECEDLGAYDPQPDDPCVLPDCGLGLRNQEDPQ